MNEIAPNKWAVYQAKLVEVMIHIKLIEQKSIENFLNYDLKI